MTGPLHLRYTAHSEIGLVRKNNQDSGYASPHLLAVADGMGGAAAGDLASAVAIQLVRKADRATRGDDPVSGEGMLEVLVGAVDQANKRIADLAEDDHLLEGMGTTFTGALFDGHQLGLVHIGDSRAYLLRDGKLERLTHDHSWVQSLVDEGKITEEEAAMHPHRSLLLKVLNGQQPNDPDASLVDVEAGDRLMFCSDGLCGLVEDEDLLVALTEDDAELAMDELIAFAHTEGGIDNITIVLADVVADEAEATTGAKVLGAATDRDIPSLLPRDEDGRPIASAEASTEEADDEDEEDPEAKRYAPQVAPTRPRWRGLVIGAVVLALIAGAVGAGFAWTRTQYYVGPAQEQVAIYRGVAQTLPGLKLNEVYEVQDTRLSDLPSFYEQRVRQTITSRSLEEARETTAELKKQSEKCIAQRQARLNPTPTPQPPTPAPSATPETPGAPGQPPAPSQPPASDQPAPVPPLEPGPASPEPSVTPTPSAAPTPEPGSENC